MEILGTTQEIQTNTRIKEDRVRLFLEQEGLDALVLTRQDHFAWFTTGADNRVLTTSETGFAYLVITKDKKFLVSHSIDAARFMEEQVPNQGFELEQLYWYEGSLQDRVEQLTAGMKVGADAPLPGARWFGSELAVRLHYPLTDLELSRIRWVGKTSHQLLAQLAREIQPGQTEQEISARLLDLYTRAGITVDVLIVGVDERVSKYRHPLPTSAVLKKYALLHPGSRRWGLHANVTRLVHFGTPPDSLQRALDGILTIEGRIFSLLQPGMRFADILAGQKQWYPELGYPEDWKFHFPGGITGYTLCDPTRCLDPQARVVNRQSFDFFVTITGAKTENLALLTEQGLEVASSGPDWPHRTVHTASGDFQLPDLLVR